MAIHKTTFKAVLLLAILALFAAACGSAADDDPINDDTPDTTDGGEPVDDEPEEDLEPATLSPVLQNMAGIGDVQNSENEDYVSEIAGVSNVAFNGEVCPIAEGDDSQIFYPISFLDNSFFVIGSEGDEARLEEEGFDPEPLWTEFADGEPVRTFYRVSERPDEVPLSIGALIEPDHLYAMNPIHRGHPVDLPEDVGEAIDVHDPAGAGGGSLVVAVVDAELDPTHPYSEHGHFIISVLEQMDATGVPFFIPVVPGTTDSLFFQESDLVSALEQVELDTTIEAINLSLGTYGCEEYSPVPLTSQLAAIGLPVVASAGNDGSPQHTYPAAAFAAVGSTAPDGRRSCFSNYGPWVTHWIPGEEVLGTLSDGSPVTWSGTSFAAPQIAAQIASGATGFVASTPADIADDQGYDCPAP